MAKVMTTVAIISLCMMLMLVSLQSISAEDPYSEITPEEQAFWNRMLNARTKRLLCRPGFTFNPVSRNCNPSLGVLRGRGRQF